MIKTNGLLPPTHLTRDHACCDHHGSRSSSSSYNSSVRLLIAWNAVTVTLVIGGAVLRYEGAVFRHSIDVRGGSVRRLEVTGRSVGPAWMLAQEQNPFHGILPMLNNLKQASLVAQWHQPFYSSSWDLITNSIRDVSPTIRLSTAWE